MAVFPGLPGWTSSRKVKPIWIFLKQETVSGRGISWAMCKSAPRSRQITTPAPHHSFFTGRMLFLPPNQQRQSTIVMGKSIRIDLPGWIESIPIAELKLWFLFLYSSQLVTDCRWILILNWVCLPFSNQYLFPFSSSPFLNLVCTFTGSIQMCLLTLLRSYLKDQDMKSEVFLQCFEIVSWVTGRVSDS